VLLPWNFEPHFRVQLPGLFSNALELLIAASFGPDKASMHSFPQNRATLRLEGFGAYAKEWLTEFNGVSKYYFPLYLKDMEFRHRHRRQDLFDHLVKCLCNLGWDLLQLPK